MARFILDIANLSDEQILNAMNTVQDTFSDTVCSICCIDKSNEGQFYSDDEIYALTDKQIQKFNNQ